MRVGRYSQENTTELPVSGGGSALVVGALLKRGTTDGTNLGVAILATGSALHANTLGILQEAHATANDTDAGGTIFTTHPVDIIGANRIVRISYSTLAADIISATQLVNTTTMTITSLEASTSGAFYYVVSGAGAGQTNFITASAAGSATLKAAFGTNLDATSRLIKILPRFHLLGSLSADGTALRSQAAAGLWGIVVIDQWIVRSGDIKRMSPVTEDALTGLNSLSSIRFEADIIVKSSIYTID